MARITIVVPTSGLFMHKKPLLERQMVISIKFHRLPIFINTVHV